MKNYIGCDIIEVERIKEAVKDPKFKHRVFTAIEIEYCEGKGDKTKYQSYAARFAAKEAVFKAISKKLENKYELSWTNIEITNDVNGRPVVKLIETNIENVEIDVSISHVKEYAMATAVVTTK